MTIIVTGLVLLLVEFGLSKIFPQIARVMRMLAGLTAGIFLIPITVHPMMLLTKNFVLGWSLGGIMWAWLYCRITLAHFTFYTKVNEGNLLSDSFKAESSAVQTSFTGNRRLKALTEYQAGWHWRFPHEEVVSAVDMTRQIIITHDDGEAYTLPSKELLEIKYQVVVVPLPGNISNYIQTPPKEIRRQVKARVTAFIQGYVGRLTSVQEIFTDAGFKAFEEAFEEKFGAAHVIEDFERNLGIWTSTAAITDVDEPKAVQESRNKAQGIKLIMDKAHEIVTNSIDKTTKKPTITEKEALEFAYNFLIASGNAQVSVVDLKTLGGRIFR